MTVSAGTDHTTSSMRPEYTKSGRKAARLLEARNQNAKAKIARIVGSTIASMMATESIRMVFSAAPIGPCGSRIFIAEPKHGTLGKAAAARMFLNNGLDLCAGASAHNPAGPIFIGD